MQPSPGDIGLNMAREVGFDVETFYNIGGEAVIERAQRAENDNVIHRRRVEAMQREMDILKNTVEKLPKERYPPANTQQLGDTSR